MGVKILGLDLAFRTTGWAITDEDGSFQTGLIRTGKQRDGEDRIHHLARVGEEFRDRFHEVLWGRADCEWHMGAQLCPIDAIVYEYPDWITRHPKMEALVASRLGFIEGVFLGHDRQCYFRGVRQGVGALELKRFIAGKSNATKKMVREVVQTTYTIPGGMTDDEVDALAICIYGRDLWNRTIANTRTESKPSA